MMKKKIKFSPLEFTAVTIEAIVSACLTASGVPIEQSKLVGACLGGVTKGLYLSDNGLGYTILSSLEKSIVTALDSNSFELPDICKELLRTDALSSKKIIEFMCQSESYMSLRKQIILTCKRDPDCDIITLPIDEIVSDIIRKFELEALNNHELASYASYCILRKNAFSTGVYLANQLYVNSFEEPLFLHKNAGISRVNLKNLFILQKFKILKYDNEHIQDDSNELQKNLNDVIADYLNKNRDPFLFIEGDAGCGKTSLIAWMNYHYSLGDDIAAQLFGNRPLLTIRLRDLDKKDISKNGSLSFAICKYINLSSLDLLESLFPKAIMILEGYDELCMIEGVGVDHETFLYDLHQKDLEGFQFIVTTRPKFISPQINLPSIFIFLQHFDSEQREIWLDHYISDEYCAQTIDKVVYSYIKSIDDSTSSCICDTPMTLYMLAAKKGSAAFLDNNWALYRHIFFNELSRTEYNKMFPNPDRKYSHDISILRDVLYQVSEEIAYQMFKNENQSFYLSDCELSAIVERLGNQIDILKNANMRTIAERCYALCCYWKADSNRGAVEFLHNNIRDFFLAEKIYREMDEITQCIKTNGSDKSYYKLFTDKLCSLFQYGFLETNVAEFIYLRAKYKAEKNEPDFAQYEYKNNLIAKIIAIMSRNGIINSGVLAERLPVNPIQRMTNILACTIQLYRNIYEAHIKEAEIIRWVSESSNKSSILLSIFKQIFCQVPVTIAHDHMITLGSRGCFNALNFNSLDLRNIDFQGSHIKSAKFSDTVLYGCDFSNAILNGSDFTNADIHYASLKGASLISCNMTGADLRGTELPDGFSSTDQDEQVEHLKSLQINGLRL